MEAFGAILVSAVVGIVPMVIFATVLLWFDRYEKEPWWLVVGVFLWGAIVAAGGALIFNTVFGISLFVVSGSEVLANVGAAVISAPFFEETLKGLAVFGVFLLFRHEFDSLLDGIIYGSLVGFGFAAAENVNYAFTGFNENGWEGLLLVGGLRLMLIPFLHAFLTSFTGLGLAIARLNKGFIRYLAPIIGYGLAMGLHALHNLLSSTGIPIICLASSVLDWIGFFSMFIFILVLVWREGILVRDQLREEVSLGIITDHQWRQASSVWGQIAARWGALFGGRWLKTGKFYDLCGELAFKKHQLARLGVVEERKTPATIYDLRAKIKELSMGLK